MVCRVVWSAKCPTDTDGEGGASEGLSPRSDGCNVPPSLSRVSQTTSLASGPGTIMRGAPGSLVGNVMTVAPEQGCL